MKKILSIIFALISFACMGQVNYSAKAYRSFNADSLTVQAETVGLELFYDHVGVMYYNTGSDKWRCYATGTGWYDCGSGGGGGGGGAVWGGITGTLSNQTDLQTALDAKYFIVNAPVVITDASSMDITAPVHTLTTSSATRTFTQSYTGVYSIILITLNATSCTITFPAGALCTYEGVSSGNNIMVISGVSGDKHEISVANYGSGVYSINGINKGQN